MCSRQPAQNNLFSSFGHNTYHTNGVWQREQQYNDDDLFYWQTKQQAKMFPNVIYSESRTISTVTASPGEIIWWISETMCLTSYDLRLLTSIGLWVVTGYELWQHSTTVSSVFPLVELLRTSLCRRQFSVSHNPTQGLISTKWGHQPLIKSTEEPWSSFMYIPIHTPLVFITHRIKTLHVEPKENVILKNKKVLRQMT